MKHEFLVVQSTFDRDQRKPHHSSEYAVIATADTMRDARERAESCAQSKPGVEYTIYTKGPTFRGKVEVSTDEPQAGPA